MKTIQVNAIKREKIQVEITPQELRSAIINCEGVKLRDLVRYLHEKRCSELNFNKGMHIHDGWWYLNREDDYGRPIAPLQKRQATEEEIVVDDAICALEAALVINRLKGK